MIILKSFLSRNAIQGQLFPSGNSTPSEWSTVLRRIDQGETLRKVAGDYHVSYEAVWRVIRAARRHEEVLSFWNG